MSSMHTTCPANVTFLGFIIPKIFVKRPNYEVLRYVDFIILLSLLPPHRAIFYSAPTLQMPLICTFS